MAVGGEPVTACFRDDVTAGSTDTAQVVPFQCPTVSVVSFLLFLTAPPTQMFLSHLATTLPSPLAGQHLRHGHRVPRAARPADQSTATRASGIHAGAFDRPDVTAPDRAAAADRAGARHRGLPSTWRSDSADPGSPQ